MTGARIMVVEDNTATRTMTRLALVAEGYVVSEAADGETAVRLAVELPPALVLLDCKLPGMDGFEVGRQLRTLAPGVPVIAITGWSHLDESRALGAGFLDMLVKPVEPSRLVETVGRYLANRHITEAPSGKMVLVVDDDPTQLKLAQLALGSAGFEVMIADDAEAAMRAATARKPDVILSDVLMPGTDGFALCKAVRGNPDLAHVPMVLVSAHYLEEPDRELARRFGANGYVSRSAGFDAVVRAVISAIKSPMILPVAMPEGDLQAEHLRRISHQLERQASIGVDLARRVALQASTLSVLEALSDALAQETQPENMLGEMLAKCLDAAGISVGAILLYEAGDTLSVKTCIGSNAELDWNLHTPLFHQALNRGSLLVPSDDGKLGTELLDALDAKSALIVPLVARGDALGVLLMASNGAEFDGSDGLPVVRAARSVASQLAQAIALNRMFAKLAAAELRSRTLLENAHDGITISTRDGVVLEVNRRMAELLGVPEAQAIGRHVREFAPAGSGDANAALFDSVVAKGSGSVPPIPIARPDGSVVQIEFSSTVVAVGPEEFVLSIGRDVTDRLRLEEQLRQSQKMEAVGRLAGGVAHDFNNALSVILSYGELLLGDLKPGDPMRADIEEIHRAGAWAADLTRQLLLFSRQHVVEPKVLDLNIVLVGVHKILRRILGADVDLVVLPTEQLGRVRADPGSVEQVIMNLVVNARDAMPTGGKLTIETANVVLDDAYAKEHLGVTAGPHVMLAVTDNGEGMCAATMARIFEPFFTTKEPDKGTGLGLSTVFGIAQQSGGSVWVYSELGTGTTFKVYLPRVDSDADADCPISAKGTLRGSETILLVEDNAHVRVVTREILLRTGYTVLEACNAAEAIVQSERYAGIIHLLLTDVVMPGMSGPALATRLAQSRPEMKVLCFSGYTDDSIVRHGVLEASVAYLQKPITPGGLATKVREVLGNVRVPLPAGES
jgi:PAS domain S-box-containing protein